MEDLRVCMLGEFSISNGADAINDSDNRSRKVWLLLAYMIYFRNRSISQDELIDLLWGEEESSSNPANALKTMFHRVRTMLNQLGGSVGHELIVRRQGDYAWNPDLTFAYDVDRFESLCKAGRTQEDPEQRLASYLQALELYGGDFLPKLATEPWVVPVNTYFHNLYTQTVHEVIPLLEEQGRLDEAAAVCRKAIEIENCDEFLYYHLMRQLLDMGNQQAAATVFETMSDMLFDRFGVMPSDEIKALYREAIRSTNEHEVDISAVRDQLKEPSSAPGALVCDYDFFKAIYRAEARSVARSGDAAHIALLSVTNMKGAKLAKRSLDRCMENLSELVRLSLRRGDIASRCSVSQFIILLPRANYENSCMVMDRIVRQFGRQYPHSPALLRYSVQPLDPTC
ncbi:SARP family transcriptional regulator [Oscillibacter sp. MSJ-2]|uniref:SARP family transcriptional regulator n=1 Tax=Dysosmobacter acutus TaxID=2841504 RepID=A0ABS6F935_9FIRM|nr:BTAD domain-containing putative transcriptional regulator [Dysosmobacter acutus]MBU5626593.1 SARP family transcriptional regulator [Dysosmobacter acutus]